MTRARLTHSWAQTAAIQAAFLNVFRKKDSPAIKPQTLMPPSLRPPIEELSPSEFLASR